MMFKKSKMKACRRDIMTNIIDPTIPFCDSGLIFKHINPAARAETNPNAHSSWNWYPYIINNIPYSPIAPLDMISFPLDRVTASTARKSSIIPPTINQVYTSTINAHMKRRVNNSFGGVQ